MQKLIILLCLTGIFYVSCNREPQPHALFIQDDSVEVHFGRKMSQSLLDSIREVVGLKGISLSYPQVEYDGELLSKLEIVVQIEGQGGSATTNFVYRGRPFGFRVVDLKSFQPVLALGELDKRSQ